MREYPHSELTGVIIGAAIALKRRGIPFSRQVEVEIPYKGDVVGTHVLDLVVAHAVVVELKAVKELADIHKAIVLSYLAATGLPVALLAQSAKYQRYLRHQRRKKLSGIPTSKWPQLESGR